MTSEELDVAETALDSEIPPGQTTALVGKQTCVNLDTRQAIYMNKKQRKELVTSEQFLTSADKLV